ncbi:MAG: 16S rRNA (adenine(1518)-N(6)/adenine(1519)-N(6))-dimethyltransferase RsmA [Synechococcaceae cyanobacterium]|nr:16S rRNA (adenine(1518)-N(6)/adenine(1519)-N(6))-dimethyltransferase RsmA [Synechococcaceae cyanobacterium]
MDFARHRTRKRFGQHWLVDEAVLERIVAAAQIQPGEWLLEVGPGRGALTERLLASEAAGLVAVELDRDLIAGLRQRFGADPRFHLVEGDGLEAPLETPHGSLPDKVVANIPYNITGPLLERLVGRLERPVAQPFRRLVLLVQQEVGERITAPAGHSAFSALTVRMALLARCQRVCAVPPRCFRPPPKVMSEVIVLEPRPPSEALEPAVARRLDQLLRRCFASRRKMLRNSLTGLLPPEALVEAAAAAAVDLSWRPQDVPVEGWLALERELRASAEAGEEPPVQTGAQDEATAPAAPV